ncbi:MAG: CRISPR-associated endoribonuclease Cas6 [Defluviitaleaceae bacterium]|nr:CRISPR-associated endoribonuclease Cas6 [Defluviitaleaceae bacterium]
MRIECIFKGEKIPISYQYLFASIIKQAISTSSEEKFKEIYYFGDKKTKQSKSFTFSVFMRDFEILKDDFEVKGDLKLIISSPDNGLMLYIYNGLLAKREFKYKGYELSLQRINLVKEHLPTKGEALFKTLSPIVVKSKDGDFICPENKEYEDDLNYISNEIIKGFRGYGLKTSLEFIPVQMKKQVVKLKHEEFASLNEDQILYVNAYSGTFKLKGDPEDLSLIAQMGLGFRRSAGFGNVQFVSE